MTSDDGHTDFELAAADLEAAADAMVPFLERIEGILAIMDANPDWKPEDFPAELSYRVDDLFAVHQSGQRAFMRHIAIYPDLRNEWIPATLQRMKMTFTRGHRDVFAEKIGVLRHCASIARARAGLPSANDGQPSHVFYGDVHMGDKYSVGQAGAIGPGAHAHDMTFQQIWNQSADSIDLQTLASELSLLAEAMREDASDPEDQIAIGNISAAQKAATTGDGPKAIEYLKNAGQWALQAAQKIGVDVAVAAIKSSLGLQK